MGKGYNKGKKRLTGKEGEYEAWGQMLHRCRKAMGRPERNMVYRKNKQRLNKVWKVVKQ